MLYVSTDEVLPALSIALTLNINSPLLRPDIEISPVELSIISSGAKPDSVNAKEQPAIPDRESEVKIRDYETHGIHFPYTPY